MTEREQKNPIVFQCKECFMVLTDTFFLLERINDTLVFSCAPNTNLSTQVITSTEETDAMCTYSKVSCRCGVAIGRKYHTVSQKLSRCLDKYVIATERIRGYQLGTPAEPIDPIIMNNTEISTEIIRLQKFCTYLYGKIKEQENRIQSYK
ncbi:hypothetical protein NEOKW01_1852 [Nematocida sp. AWRm80]|nr:hypothetical protein NEOKW01_1852 [Nematocida sp. AWRm80]